MSEVNDDSEDGAGAGADGDGDDDDADDDDDDAGPSEVNGSFERMDPICRSLFILLLSLSAPLKALLS